MRPAIVVSTLLLGIAAAAFTDAQPLSPLVDSPSEVECPLGRVAR